MRAHINLFFDDPPCFAKGIFPWKNDIPTDRMTEIEIFEDIYVARVANLFAGVVKNSVLPRWRSAAINRSGLLRSLYMGLISSTMQLGIPFLCLYPSWSLLYPHVLSFRAEMMLWIVSSRHNMTRRRFYVLGHIISTSSRFSPIARP